MLLLILIGPLAFMPAIFGTLIVLDSMIGFVKTKVKKRKYESAEIYDASVAKMYSQTNPLKDEALQRCINIIFNRINKTVKTSSTERIVIDEDDYKGVNIKALYEYLKSLNYELMTHGGNKNLANIEDWFNSGLRLVVSWENADDILEMEGAVCECLSTQESQ